MHIILVSSTSWIGPQFKQFKPQFNPAIETEFFATLWFILYISVSLADKLYGITAPVAVSFQMVSLWAAS